MIYPVDLVPEARAELVELAVLRPDPITWFLDAIELIDGLGDREPGHPILHEQPDDPSLPLLRELFVPPGRAEVRIVFHFNGTRVRVVHARWATNRPLTDREVRRFARR